MSEGLIIKIQQSELRGIAQFAFGKEFLDFPGRAAAEVQDSGSAPRAGRGSRHLDQPLLQVVDAIAVGRGRPLLEQPHIEHLCEQ